MIEDEVVQSPSMNDGEIGLRRGSPELQHATQYEEGGVYRRIRAVIAVEESGDLLHLDLSCVKLFLSSDISAALFSR